MKKFFKILFPILTISGYIFYSIPAFSQSTEQGQEKVKEAKEKKKKGPVVLEEVVIEGRVQKPQAFYILQRSSFGYKITEIEESFVDEVVNSVNNEIF